MSPRPRARVVPFDWEPAEPFSVFVPGRVDLAGLGFDEAVDVFVKHALPCHQHVWGAVLDADGAIMVSNENGTRHGRVWLGVRAAFESLEQHRLIDPAWVAAWEAEAALRASEVWTT